MRTRILSLAGPLCGLVLVVTTPARAAAAPADVAALESRLADEPGTATLRLLRDKGVITAEEYRAALEDADQHRRPAVEVKAAPGQGFTVTTADRGFSTNWRMRMMARTTLQAITRPPGDTTPQAASDALQRFGRDATADAQLRAVRVMISGHAVTRDLRYNLQLGFGSADYEAGSAVPVMDAWLEYARFRDAQVRVGQFFVPFERARTLKESSFILADRTQEVNELQLDRDVGAMVASTDVGGLGGRVGYNVFLGTGDGRNRLAPVRPGLLVVGRFTLRPFGAFDDDSVADLDRSLRPRIAVAVAAAFNHAAQRQRGTLGRDYALGGFDYLHANADAVLKFAGFYFLGQVTLRKALVDRRVGNVDGKDVTEWSRSAVGMTLEGNYTVTQRLVVAVRYDRLMALGPTDPQLEKRAREAGHEFGTGFAVLLNGHNLKIHCDYQLQAPEEFSGPLAHIARTQFEATF